jgi:hypothetical protein
MFGSSLLDVAIGTIFVYLLLSLICSAGNEIIESWLKKRASYLEQGIRQLLDDPSGEGLASKLYGHPLVSSLFPGTYDPKQISKGGSYASRSDLPSYIPSRNFALALMDIIQPAQPETDKAAATPSGAAGAIRSPKVSADAENPLTPLRDAIGKNASGQTQTALLALVDAAGGDIVKARENIEDWYDSSMDRVSGWYKRRAHAIILILGLGVAIALNADTIYIVRSLANDSTLRSSLVAAATEYAKEPPSEEGTADDQFSNNIRTIEGLGLPIGWTKDASDPARRSPGLPWRDTSPGTWIKDWVRLFYWHWLGWIITAAAISQGAPFWFDLLNRFIVIRSTVKPHEKSPEEDSKE